MKRKETREAIARGGGKERGSSREIKCYSRDHTAV